VNRASSSSNKSTGGLLSQGSSAHRRREHAQTTEDTAHADLTAASKTDETADVVSRAFERYASDRDRDRERGFGGGMEGQRPRQHP
ncbi:unnamed protein product, partial [Ectocarpus fasciculatus]